MKLLIKTTVKFYQLVLSPQTGFLKWVYLSPIFTINPSLNQGCRFETSCSNYCLESINNHGVFIGLKMSIKRVIACR